MGGGGSEGGGGGGGTGMSAMVLPTEFCQDPRNHRLQCMTHGLGYALLIFIFQASCLIDSKKRYHITKNCEKATEMRAFIDNHE